MFNKNYSILYQAGTILKKIELNFTYGCLK